MFVFFKELFLFLLVLVGFFYLPGKFLIFKLKLKLDFLQGLFLSIVLGMLFFVLIVYVFSWLKTWFLVIPIFIFLDILLIKNRGWKLPPLEKNHQKPIVLVVVLSIIFSLSMTSLGLWGDKIGFVGRDDFWHLALINELKAHFPPDNPGFAGVPLKGYHFFYNFLLAKLSQISFLSPLSLYFHFFPLLNAILWGLGVYILMLKWSRDKRVSLWAVFLSMFGGSFAFYLHLKGHTNLSLNSSYGISQPISSLINPPFSISIVILVAALFSVYNFLETRKVGWLVPLILAGGLITMFKVYAGMILLGGLAGLAVLDFFKKRYQILLSFFPIGILFLTTYWLLADRSASLIFFPLWAPRKVMVDNLPWYGYGEKYYTYSRLSVIRGLIKIELYGLWIFLFGSLGTRIFGLGGLIAKFLRKERRFALFAQFLLGTTLISILVPLFFIQTGKVFEIIQMAWYFLFFCSLWAAFGFVYLMDLIKNCFLKGFFFLLVISLTLPSAFEDYQTQWRRFQNRSSFTTSYYETMAYLNSQGNYDDTVLEIPPQSVEISQKAILNWYGTSTPAIVVFGNKRAFFAYEYIDFPNLEPKTRAVLIEEILKANQTLADEKSVQDEVFRKLKKEGIVYIYSPYSIGLLDSIKGIDRIFQNKAATIYRVI